jgi:ABC-type sugar transport system ATPase subunit
MVTLLEMSLKVIHYPIAFGKHLGGYAYHLIDQEAIRNHFDKYFRRYRQSSSKTADHCGLSEGCQHRTVLARWKPFQGVLLETFARGIDTLAIIVQYL